MDDGGNPDAWIIDRGNNGRVSGCNDGVLLFIVCLMDGLCSMCISISSTYMFVRILLFVCLRQRRPFNRECTHNRQKNVHMAALR